MEQALAGAAVSNEDEVRREALPFEFMLNALRLREGFAMADFAARTGLPPSAVDTTLEQARQRGLLEIERDAIGRVAQVRPSERGFDFLSDLQAMFLA